MTHLTESARCADQPAIWAASALAGTHKPLTFARPLQPAKRPVNHEVIVVNPSSISALNVKVYNVQASLLSTMDTWVLLGEFVVPVSPALVLHTGEAAWDESDPVTGVTVTADGVVYAVGAASAKMAMAAGAGIGLLATELMAATNISMYDHIHAWARSSIALTAGQVVTYLDDTAKCASPTETLSVPALATPDTFTRIRMPLADPTACAAIASIGVGQTTDLGVFDFYIDDVQAVKHGQIDILLQGLFNGGDLNVYVYNDTVLGANDAFTAYFRLTEM